MEAFDVRTLPSEGKSIDQPIEPEWLEASLAAIGDTPEEAVLPRRAGRLRIDLSRVGSKISDTPTIRLKGRVEAPVYTCCVRCLAEVDLAVDTEVDLTLFPESEIEGQAGEEGAELSAEDLEDATYEGFELDIPAIVRELLLLSIDMNPTCADDEACQARTDALIAEANGDPPEPEDDIDPRWAELRKFRLKSG